MTGTENTHSERQIYDAALVSDALFVNLTERTASYSDMVFRLVSMGERAATTTERQRKENVFWK
jgi:hypothetical protein